MAQNNGERFNLNLEPATEHVVRHGDAQKLYDPEKVRLEGTITAPSEYFTKRESTFNKNEAHVKFDKYGPSIILVVGEHNHFYGEITGKLKRHKFLNSLQINNGKEYSITSLRETLRFGKRFFYPMETHTDFLKKLRNFTVKIESKEEQADDRAGNKKKSLETKVEEFTGENKLEFTLRVPLFEGTDDIDLKITTELDVINGNLAIYLMCDELEMLEDELIKSIWEKEKEIFQEIVIIDK